MCEWVGNYMCNDVVWDSLKEIPCPKPKRLTKVEVDTRRITERLYHLQWRERKDLKLRKLKDLSLE